MYIHKLNSVFVLQLLMEIKYFVIHNLDEERYLNSTKLFKKYGVNINDVIFINHPNKNELTYSIKKKSVQKNSKIKDGWISCSYKHYLALKNIVENEIPLAVVMEDNIGDFYEKVPNRIEKYLSELPSNWDVVFDSVWSDYRLMNEESVSNNKLVYKKSHEETFNAEGVRIAGGSTRAAQFYLLNIEAAKKIYDNFLPFNHSADMWLNEVLRKVNANVYWSEPSLVVSKFNKTTSTNISNKYFFYKVKSYVIDKILGI